VLRGGRFGFFRGMALIARVILFALAFVWLAYEVGELVYTTWTKFFSLP